MSEFQLKLIEVAQSQIGVREDPDKDNTGEDVLKYMSSSWMPEESNDLGYAWCAVFVGWCVSETCKALGLNDLNYHYMGAAAFGWEKFANKKSWKLFTEDELALPGDIVTFDFSHVGIVIEDVRDRIITVEGNTNADGERDGDGVYRKERAPRSLVRRFIRIP